MAAEKGVGPQAMGTMGEERRAWDLAETAALEPRVTVLLLVVQVALEELAVLMVTVAMSVALVVGMGVSEGRVVQEAMVEEALATVEAAV